MTKVVRAAQVEAVAEDIFGKRLRRLEQTVEHLKKKIDKLEALSRGQEDIEVVEDAEPKALPLFNTSKEEEQE